MKNTFLFLVFIDGFYMIENVRIFSYQIAVFILIHFALSYFTNRVSSLTNGFIMAFKTTYTTNDTGVIVKNDERTSSLLKYSYRKIHWGLYHPTGHIHCMWCFVTYPVLFSMQFTYLRPMAICAVPDFNIQIDDCGRFGNLTANRWNLPAPEMLS